MITIRLIRQCCGIPARWNVLLNYNPNGGSWTVGLFVDNLTGGRDYAALSPTTILLGGYSEGAPMPPRTFGIHVLKTSLQ